MVNPNDYVDLEPAPEDILSVWGLELTQQNLVKVVLLARSPLDKSFGMKLNYKNAGGLALLEETKTPSSRVICCFMDLEGHEGQ